MATDSGTDKAARREKIVMALGIAALVLFSANLLTMLARHFWPHLTFERLLMAEQGPVINRFEPADEAANDDVHVMVKRWKHNEHCHKFSVRLRADGVDEGIATSIEADLEALERDIAIQSRRLERDMQVRREAEEDARRRLIRSSSVGREVDRALQDLEIKINSLGQSSDKTVRIIELSRVFEEKARRAEEAARQQADRAAILAEQAAGNADSKR